MDYRQLQPSPGLRSLVDSIWIQESAVDDCACDVPPTRVLPAAKVDLVFYYREPFVRVDRGNREVLPRYSICGLRSHPIDVAATGRSGVIIVNLVPWAFARLRGVPVSDVANQMLDIREVWGDRLCDLFENRFAAAGTTETRVRVIERFLRSLAKGDRNDADVVEASWRIQRTSGNLAIGQLASDLGTSRRHLLRRFQEFMGVPPKVFARIVRFQRALTAVRLGKHWSNVIAGCGYYDQAHFIHEIREFSGVSPTALNADRVQTPLMEHFNGAMALSHSYNTTYLQVA